MEDVGWEEEREGHICPLMFSMGVQEEKKEVQEAIVYQ